MEMNFVKDVKNILVVFDENENLDAFIEDLKEKASASITLKTVSDLNDKYPSIYDLIISGFENGIGHTTELFSIYLKLLKPNGTIVLRNVTLPGVKLPTLLKISGFTKISESTNVNVNDEALEYLKKNLNIEGDVNVVEISCSKPNYEIGSSAKLTLNIEKEVDKKAVWKIDGNDDDNDVIDPDSLLDDEDLKKPDPGSLRVCGTTGKRKACKDCSCGLSEELEAEGKPKVNSENAKSSCGSCYLGDAFRCATCPYLGMPAFKPGEKIQLAGNQLQSDI